MKNKTNSQKSQSGNCNSLSLGAFSLSSLNPWGVFIPAGIGSWACNVYKGINIFSGMKNPFFYSNITTSQTLSRVSRLGHLETGKNNA